MTWRVSASFHSLRFLYVTEYLSDSTAGMLCSHSDRAAPLKRYAERCSAVGAIPAKHAADSRSSSRNAGMSSARCNRWTLKSYCQPNEMTRRLAVYPWNSNSRKGRPWYHFEPSSIH